MTKFIIPVVVGAVIGYITNWLAIKMLFRPHREMRLFGYKIPFTPGLIPKERNRIAKNVGETVGTHLLSPEMIINSLNNEEVSKQIEKWFDQRADSLRHSDISLGDWLKSLSNTSCGNMVGVVEKALREIVAKEVQNPHIQKKVAEAIHKAIFRGNLVDSNLYASLKGKFIQIINSPMFFDSAGDAAQIFISDVFRKLKEEDKALKDIISPTISGSLKVYIYNHKEAIANFLRDSLNDDKVHDKLKSSIVTLIELNFGKLVTMFMNPENIAIKVIVAAINYLGKPENQDDVADIAVKFVDMLLEMKTSEILEEVPGEVQQQLIRETGHLVANFASKVENQSLIINLFEGRIRENEEAIREGIGQGILLLVKDMSSSKEFEISVSSFIHDGVCRLLNMKLSEILLVVDESGVHTAKTLILDSIRNFIRNRADKLANLLDVPKIVEDKINSFDVEFAESLILDVAKKELSAITWLGALLGAIMGIMSPVLEILTK